MKKLLTFFTMLVSLLCLPLTASAWYVDSSHPGTIIGNTFTDVNGKDIDTWNAGEGIPLEWDSSASAATGIFVAKGNEAYMKFSAWNGSGYDGMSLAGDYNVSSSSGYSSNFTTNYTQTVVKGLTAGNYYKVYFRAVNNGAAVQVKINPTNPPYPSTLYIKGGSGITDGTSYAGNEGVFTIRFTNTEGSWFQLSDSSSDFGSSHGVKPASPNHNSVEFKMEGSGETTVTYPAEAKSFVPAAIGDWVFTVDLKNGKMSYTYAESKPATPVISDADTDTNQISISCSTADAVIYYTIDGSTPSASNGVRYSAPFIIASDITVKAIAIKGDKTSDVASKDVTYTSHRPATPVITVADNMVSIACDGATTIYYTTDGSTPTTASTVYSAPFAVPAAGFPQGIRAIGYNADGLSEQAAEVAEVKYALATPEVSVTTVDGKGVFTITNPLPGTATISWSTTTGLNGSSQDASVTVTVEASCSLTASASAAGMLSSASATQSWENPADKKPIYYVSKSRGWNKASDSTKPNVIAIPWDAEQNAYVLSGAVAETGTSNTFRFSNADNPVTWDDFNGSSKVATMTAGEAGEVKTAALTHSTNNNLNCDVSKVGYWTIKINGDFTSMDYSWDGPLSEDVTRTGWSLYSTRTFPVGTSKFFYLSAEQNDSRVSPEWELLPQTDGSYAINNFMVIPAGQFIIRQIDRKGTDSFEIHDWGHSSGGKVVNSAELSIPTSGEKVASGSYTKDYDMVDNAARGWMWNIGYTMASVRVAVPTPVKPVKVDNDGRTVIYYKGDLDALWLWKDNGAGTQKSFDNNGATDANGYKHYAVKAGEDYNKVIFKKSDTWSGQYPSGDGANLSFTAGTQVVCYQNSDLVLYDNFSEPAGDLKVTLTANLDRPSTLKVAKRQGMPYVAFMGEFFATQKGDDQDELNYIANLQSGGDNSAPNNTGFTNGWIYHNAEGNPVIYSDASVATRTGTRNGSSTNLYFLTGRADNMNMSAAQGSGSNSLRANVAVYSTRQPPVYPIKFFGTSGGQVIELTSSELRLDYVGEETSSFTFTGSDGKYYTTPEIRVARYETSNVPMLGRLKLFSGFGAQQYGSAWNGLSLYNNWGGTKSDGGEGAYTFGNAQSKVDVPLSGGGAKHHNSSYDGTARGITERTNIGGIQNGYGNEDNNAGNYINFSDRTYVSKAEFFFALESDSGDGFRADNADGANKTAVSINVSEHSADSGYDTGSNARPTNTGRNFSWLRFSFTGADQRIELDKEGAATGRVTYAINEDEVGDEYIESYTVYLYKVDPNIDETDPETGEENPDHILSQVWTSDLIETPEHPKSVAETIRRISNLDNGWYQAKIVTTFNSDDPTHGRHTEPDWSRMIQVFPAAGAPDVTAEQVIGSAVVDGSTVREFSLDVLVKADVASFAEANLTEQGEPNFAGISTTLTMPREQGNKLMVDLGDGNGFVDAAGLSGLSVNAASWTYSVAAGYFSESKTALPAFKVLNTLPGQQLTYTVAARVQGATAEKTDRATVTIAAPLARYVGEASFEANWADSGLDGVTAVSVDGHFELVDPADSETPATLAGTTEQAYDLAYSVLYSDNRDKNVQWPAVTAPGADRSAPAYHLPYYPAVDADGVAVPAAQAYSFVTTLSYGRKADSKAASVKALPGNVTTDNLTLYSPRQGIADKKATHAPSFISDGDYHSGTREANDYVRIMANWQEKWGGVNNQVEDALIAAEVSQPSANTVYRFDAGRQAISHHARSVFNPARHYVSETADDGVHAKAPGKNVTDSKSFWYLHGALSKTQHQERHPNFVERVGRDWGTAGDAYINDADGFNDDRFNLWAGCRVDADGNYINVNSEAEGGRVIHYDSKDNIPEGDFDKADAFHGYYGSRNHHIRKGWKGGELFSRDWFIQAFAKTANNEGTENVQVATLLPNTPFANAPAGGTPEQWANTVLMFINMAVESGTGLPLIDSEYSSSMKQQLGEDVGKWIGKTIFLSIFQADPAVQTSGGFDPANTGRIMLKVNHVNHESWYGYNANVMEQWDNGKNFTWPTDVKTFADKLNAVRIDKKFYTPVTYDFSYEYPMLTTGSRIVFSGVNVGQTLPVSLRAAASRAAFTPINNSTLSTGESTDVVARATGLIAFDGANDSANDIVTAIESVGADQAGANGCYFRYSREAQTLTAISPAGVGAINVTTVDGRSVKKADGNGAETFAISLAGLADGWYVVTAEGVGSMKLLK
ncbi:MAG: chitobiase/beta-hexosaminidase C-terminal domain-containing protein [Candidatus Amulumruptor caecigallinarius]|nr:chitobiase/beta-hexosaminidase C-terminal domain-containing protein [Candidatus Amulumruptor caecigallinarius]MCM1396382.1 chitobiase/beta-hexosaminidase C-terminal domain-containing protein [Candidatus Amulumruptor caecigallinarius]MCM1453561.1 chitobiase/beta-hexosaminidase C-terminal domain-containing protein [bacterium]